jgi:4-coumarate--CoA ligase
MIPAPSRAALHRIACAVVAAEVRRLRGSDLPMPHHWPDATAIGDDGLGLDSLERLGALGALAETFGLDDAMLGAEPPRLVGEWTDWVMRRHARGDGRITVRTSGSTGDPVPCPHDIADLLDEARFMAAQLPGRQRIVALVPAHHLYGIIWAALLPDALDVPVITPPLGTALHLAPGDLIVAVPDQWRAILRLTRDFPADVVGVSSAAPLDDALAADLAAAGLARLLDIYGSSETAGIALRTLPATGYDLLPRWRLQPQGEGDWRLADRDGTPHPLPDHIERIGERGLRPTGRRDGAVQVGGHNVWPARVAAMLRGLDGIADAAVRLDGNGRLKAFIVPDGDRDPADLAPLIDGALIYRLSAAERPRRLRFGSALPRNAMGKLEDWS